jgi:hypothetical protein
MLNLILVSQILLPQTLTEIKFVSTGIILTPTYITKIRERKTDEQYFTQRQAGGCPGRGNLTLYFLYGS